MALRKLYRFLSLDVWGRLPSYTQRSISAAYTSLYNASWSRHLIGPYTKIHYNDPEYLAKFQPASGSDTYMTFQDFFIRKFRMPPQVKNSSTWPCEGYLCEYDLVEKIPEVNVKKQRRSLRVIFGEGGNQIPDHYYFSNVFLHNRDYHRIHAPTNGIISRIEHIPGDLVLLRPWIYQKDPSHPALRNERYNVDITDEKGRIWFLSIVGGPAVGSIMLDENTVLNTKISVGEEIATFLLGSTCCMAIPDPISKQVGENVQIGEPL